MRIQGSRRISPRVMTPMNNYSHDTQIASSGRISLNNDIKETDDTIEMRVNKHFQNTEL